MEMHPLFERVPEEEVKIDPCIKFMTEGTDEAKKVIRNDGKMWYAVYRKRGGETDKEKQVIDSQVQSLFT